MASRKLYLTFAIFLIILLPLLARSGTLAITGATIIDGTGSDPIRRGVVLLTDDRITAVGASRAVEIPESATPDRCTRQIRHPRLDGCQSAPFSQH